jgi:hypothetical protein
MLELRRDMVIATRWMPETDNAYPQSDDEKPRKARPMAFRKEFRHLLGRKLLRHHGAQITRTISKRHRPGYGRWTPSSGHPENAETRWSTAHAGGRVGVETADSRTGGFLPQPGGSLRQSLTAGAPWRAQTAPREASAGLIAPSRRTWPEACVLRRSWLL